MIKIVILISGNGSNLQAIIDAAKKGLPAKVSAVISNEPTAYGLERAQQSHIPNHVISHRDFGSRSAFDAALKKKIDLYDPDFIILAGFMRWLSTDFVNSYYGKLINIHPSLLPKYPGLHTYERVLQSGDQQHGTSIHFVTDVIDSGPLIAQESVPIESDDTPETLKKRIQVIEHQLYPLVIRLLAEGRVTLNKDTVLLDNQVVVPRNSLLLGCKGTIK